MLEGLCTSVQSANVRETALLDSLVAKGPLKGRWERETPLAPATGERGIVDDPANVASPPAATRFADAVCQEPSADWVIEAKRNLSYQALGQVLAYGILYEGGHPGRTVRRAVVCELVDPVVLQACRRFDVRVFQVVSGEVVAL